MAAKATKAIKLSIRQLLAIGCRTLLIQPLNEFPQDEGISKSVRN